MSETLNGGTRLITGLIGKSLRSIHESCPRFWPTPCMYFRASRCHIVNLDHVANVTPPSKGALTLQLNDGLRIEMSRRRAADFKQLMHL